MGPKRPRSINWDLRRQRGRQLVRFAAHIRAHPAHPAAAYWLPLLTPPHIAFACRLAGVPPGMDLSVLTSSCGGDNNALAVLDQHLDNDKNEIAFPAEWLDVKSRSLHNTFAALQRWPQDGLPPPPKPQDDGKERDGPAVDPDLNIGDVFTVLEEPGLDGLRAVLSTCNVGGGSVTDRAAVDRAAASAAAPYCAGAGEGSLRETAARDGRDAGMNESEPVPTSRPEEKGEKEKKRGDDTATTTITKGKAPTPQPPQTTLKSGHSSSSSTPHSRRHHGDLFHVLDGLTDDQHRELLAEYAIVADDWYREYRLRWQERRRQH